LLIETEAIEKAEQECLKDDEARARKRERAALRRAELDSEYVTSFASRLRELYPKCPKGKEKTIAEHACLKYSGRVGRSSKAKNFDEKAILLAVIAHIRHAETQYDQLLSKGCDRWGAREKVKVEVERILTKWKN